MSAQQRVLQSFEAETQPQPIATFDDPDIERPVYKSVVDELDNTPLQQNHGLLTSL